MIKSKFCTVLASILLIKLIFDFDKKTIIAVSIIAFLTVAIIPSPIYNGGIQQAMAHNPNIIPQVIAPSDGQVFTFDATQGPSARIFVEAIDPDAEDLVDISSTPLPPGAFYEALETDRQPSTGLIIFGDGFPLLGTYSITFTAVDFQTDEDGSPAPGHGATSLPVTITIIVKKTPKCFGAIPTIIGSGDPDIIRGTPNDDVIFGGAGDDDIRGGGGNDLICGGYGNDKIRGGRGNDMLNGNFGDDRIFGWLGDDNIFGDLGDDTVDGGDGKDNCRGETMTLCETTLHKVG
jgi:Ca2+-binding RTX toxin-like protein